MQVTERVSALDIGLFDQIESQSTEDDRRSLLAIHAALATRLNTFSYLEIGSHLSGTLQAVLADPRCTSVVSLDPRPEWQPDDRGAGGCEYQGNSTDRMLSLLSEVPSADLGKLTTIEAGTEDVSPRSVGLLDLCFIDGEHTQGAVLRDARFCRTALGGEGIILFHDFTVIGPAVIAFLRETPLPHRAYWLTTTVFAIELGSVTLLDDRRVRGQLRRPERAWVTSNRLKLHTTFAAAEFRRRSITDPIRKRRNAAKALHAARA